MRKQSKLLAGASVAALAIAAVPYNANAGGFALKERSAKAQGLSFAGSTAGSGGLSSLGFNPATLHFVEGTEVYGGLSFVFPQADGEVTVGGVPTGETVDADRPAGLGYNYIGHRIDSQFAVGLGVYTPFGLVTQYEPNNWTGSGDGITSRLLTINIAPTVAWTPVENFTVAFSGNIIFANARLTTSDLNIQGDTVSASFAAGIMWEPIEGTTIGLSYQHGYDLTLFGGAETPAAPGVSFSASADAELPATISIGLVQDVTPEFRVMVEGQWQNWSVFDQIDISVPGAGISAADPQNYDDAFFVAVGVEYDFTPAITARFGVAYDQTPTVDSDFLTGGTTFGRTVRVPDEDRIWISVGGSYDLNDHMTIDLGYSYLFALEDARVDLRTAPGTSVIYDGGAHIFSIGGSMKF